HGAAHLPQAGGDVPGQDRGARRRGDDLRPALAPVHPGAALRRADPGPGAGGEALRAPPRRRAAQPVEPAQRLPVPYALPPGDGRLRGTGAPARPATGRPLRRLSSRVGGQAMVQDATSTGVLCAGNLVLDYERREVRVGPRRVVLTYQEFEALTVLLRTPNTVITYRR